MKEANRYMKILLVVFWEKIHLGQFDLFSLQTIFYCLIGHGRNWARLLLIGSLNGQDVISFMIYYWILKQSGHDFSSKDLCDGCCMDIMWGLLWGVKVQQLRNKFVT